MNLNVYEKYISLILRITLGVVFFWGGYSKITIINHPLSQIIKTWFFLPIDAGTLVFIIGALEIIIATLLIIGLFTDKAAMFATALLVLSIISLDFELTWKDVGLLGSAVSLIISGSKVFSVDSLLSRE